MSKRFAVSGHGVRVPVGLSEVVDVRFDGERIWSFNPGRERKATHPRMGALAQGLSSPTWTEWPT